MSEDLSSKLERLKNERKPEESINPQTESEEYVYGYQESSNTPIWPYSDSCVGHTEKTKKRLRTVVSGRYVFGRWEDLGPRDTGPTLEQQDRHGKEHWDPKGLNRFKVFERSLLEVTDKGYGDPKIALQTIRAHAAAGNDAALEVLAAAEAAFKEDNYGRLPEHDEARERKILEQFYPERIANGESTKGPIE